MNEENLHTCVLANVCLTAVGPLRSLTDQWDEWMLGDSDVLAKVRTFYQALEEAIKRCESCRCSAKNDQAFSSHKIEVRRKIDPRIPASN
ncbi:MAG: hypothetical protein WCG02_01090 [Candidatus Taylorbacteria bacterium]